MNFIGTAGWSVPRGVARRFPGNGTHLQRYAQVLKCVEINSSFYRDHSRDTYTRWANSTPRQFKFAVKMPRAITHDAQLRGTRAQVRGFLAEVSGLGKKLGPLLIQLPPSMKFDGRIASRFFAMLRQFHRGAVVCEPRHESWFEARAEHVLLKHRISRVAADPSKIESGRKPGADIRRLVYYRLHGSPRVYWSNYARARLLEWATEVQRRGGKKDAWIIFDNTAAGCAASNALQFRELVK